MCADPAWVLAAAAKRGKRKGAKPMCVDVDEEAMEELAGTPTPMVMPNKAHPAYGRADKRKRKVGVGVFE